MGQDSKNIAVIFNNDANMWVEYIKNQLQKIDHSRDKMVVSIHEDNDLFPKPHPKTISTLCGARVIIVIASPGFLASLQYDKNRRCMIKDPSNAILFLCGITEDDVLISGLYTRFHDFDKWMKITHDQPEKLFRCITANIDNVDNKPAPQCQLKYRHSKELNKRVVSGSSEDKDEDIPDGEIRSVCGANGGNAPVTSSVDERWAFDITPTVIHSEEQTEVVIFFQNMLPDSCQLKVVFDEMTLPVRKRNPYTVCFIAPEHLEGDVKVSLECDKGKVGDLTLKYNCEMEKMNGLIQIHLQALELICQQKEFDSNQLDKALSKIFMDKNDTIPVAAFETLFGMHEYAASISIRHELPTLLHFAAKYGLKDFTCHLIDLPGALLAYSISNEDNDRPAEIARKHRHIELANYFDSYIEMNGVLYELMEPYMYFTIDTPWNMDESDYYNQSYVGYDRAMLVGRQLMQDDVYMDMTANEEIPGYLPMNRGYARKMQKPTHVPTSLEQKELHDIMMESYEAKIMPLETKRRITEWFGKHASGTSLPDKQRKLDQLREKLQEMFVSQDRENAGYVTHSNKGEFVQYMLRQCMRQANPYYINTKNKANNSNPNQQSSYPDEEYVYTANSPPSPQPRVSQSHAPPSNQQTSSMQRNRPVSVRMDKLIKDKGIDPTPPLPKREPQPQSHLRDRPLKSQPPAHSTKRS